MATVAFGEPPPGCADGRKAQAAYARWSARLAGWIDGKPAEHLCIGAGVWHREPIDANGTAYTRCQIIGHDAMGGRWLLACIDRPKLQFYAGSHRILPRFAGEMAPGMIPALRTLS
jgi:hypothetical protein